MLLVVVDRDDGVEIRPLLMVALTFELDENTEPLLETEG